MSIRLIKTFNATDIFNNQVIIWQFQGYSVINGEDVIGTTELKLSDGTHLGILSKGVYETIDRIRYISLDPDAP